jgi:hypothetical protein
VVSEVESSTVSGMSTREKIPERVAEDHARLLAMVGQCLAEIGIKASLTTFHNLVLYGRRSICRHGTSRSLTCSGVRRTELGSRFASSSPSGVAKASIAGV